MAIYARPNYIAEQVNSAAKQLAISFRATGDSPFDGRLIQQSIDIIDNFRASHTFPLNTFLMTLRNRAKHVHPNGLAVQRIKRLESIVIKLLFEKDMKLSQMQDIGGCRAIMPTLENVLDLRKLYSSRPLTHKYSGEKNYIDNPRDTGYRGIHLKYRFVGKGTSLPWNNLKIEIQLRTALQHKWATAVEAAATFTKQALKSNRGPQEWLRFFALMSSVFALREGCPAIPSTPRNLLELTDEIRALNDIHLFENTFAQYRRIIPHIDRHRKSKYFLVILDPITKSVKVSGFKNAESRKANSAYIRAETTLPKTTNVVLVSASSVATLKRAYPNYFLDTEAFLREVAEITGSSS
jgi:hypothetical protein